MSLSLISKLSMSHNRFLRQYLIDGVNTVGAFGDEPYAIKFDNQTGRRVALIISIDGKNVVTGEAAGVYPDDSAMILEAYSSGRFGSKDLELGAWVEDYDGGGRFVFTAPANSVAAHTDGGLSALGVIKVDVYGERFPSMRDPFPYQYGTLRGGGDSVLRSMDMPDDTPKSLSYGGVTRGSVGTGVGERISQPMRKTHGLTDPMHLHTSTVQYVWWDELAEELARLEVVRPKKALANLGSAPRLGNLGATDPRARFQRLEAPSVYASMR